MIGYKKCLDETKTKFVLVELEIEEGVEWQTPKFVRKVNPKYEKYYFNINPVKSRAASAKVIKIHGGGKIAYSLFDNSFEYKEGVTVKPINEYDKEEYACSEGIHFFLNKEDAIAYATGFPILLNTGLYSSFYSRNWNTIKDAIVDIEEEKEIQ